jgi:hypothetical protein
VTYAPCEEYDSTTPLTLLPTGWCSTKSRNGSRSLTGPPVVGAGARAGAAASATASGGSTSTGSLRRTIGGGAVGTGIGRLASRLAWRRDPRESRGSRASRPSRPPRDALVALRLTGPFTGRRSTKTQPTNGTGLPPISRPSSNSHGYSPWNSWNESLLRMRAPTLLAMLNTKASPRPMAPAGGATTSLWATAASNSASSFLSIRCPKVASTTTVTMASGNSSVNAITASLSWERLGIERPSVAMLDPSTTTTFVGVD